MTPGSQSLEQRSASPEGRRFASYFDKKFPGLIETALEEYEKRSGNHLVEVDTFVCQVARTVITALKTGQTHMTTVTNIPDDDIKFAAEWRNEGIHFGFVTGDAADWLRIRYANTREG
jgi:hypothetical protein